MCSGFGYKTMMLHTFTEALYQPSSSSASSSPAKQMNQTEDGEGDEAREELLCKKSGGAGEETPAERLNNSCSTEISVRFFRNENANLALLCALYCFV